MFRIDALTSQLSIPAVSRRHLLFVAGTAAAAVATALATHLRIPLPFSPVPVTGQTMTVLVAGALLGPVAGPISQGLFLLLGATGITAFAGGAITGVTGGYLVGFILAARLVGLVTRRTRNAAAVGLGMAAGSAIILACGAAWLSAMHGLSVSEALTVGVLPFIPGDALKLLGALAIWRAAVGVRDRFCGEPTER